MSLLQVIDKPPALPQHASQPGPQPRSSFYLAMRVLPAAQRAAMFEIYAFCRAVDDIADGSAPAPEKRAALERWRSDVHACCAGAAPAQLNPLSRHIAAFGLARADFDAVIDGMLMDAQPEPVCAPSAATLDLYCDRVASAVGRLSVKVFGMPAEDGIQLAHHLGRALQLTNILRDIDEDAAIGRAYLPRELLSEAGIEAGAAGWRADAIAAHPAVGRVCVQVAAQAQAHYDEAGHIMRRQHGSRVRAPRLMAAIYRVLLARLGARGWDWPRAAVKVGKLERVGILLRHAVFQDIGKAGE
ncbi:MAG TPA: presqualene diphosphate synthase HpnD [Telluria sp.]